MQEHKKFKIPCKLVVAKRRSRFIGAAGYFQLFALITGYALTWARGEGFQRIDAIAGYGKK